MKRLPPCSRWSVWEGPEVEGLVDIGVRTVFVRRGEPDTVQRLIAPYQRVWFCSTWKDWATVRKAVADNKDVCLEINLGSRVPHDLATRCKLYLKARPLCKLKPGDHVCVGDRYAEESFQVGSGSVVRPQSYLCDKRLM